MATRKQVMRLFPQDIPDKIYYTISEISRYTQVESHVLRYWEGKFSKLKPKRASGNQRKYTASDLDLILVIIHLVYKEGYTLEGAERKLCDAEAYEELRKQYGLKGAGRSMVASMPAIHRSSAGEKKAQEAPVPLEKLAKMKSALQAALRLLSDETT